MVGSPLVDASSVLSTLLPIFAGTGKTLSTTSGSPQANANEQSIIDQATANANNPALTDQLVQNIMTQASQAFAPVVAQQQSSGMYNTSTLQMLKDNAMARATQESAQTVLNYRTSQQQIADAASKNLLAANQSRVSRTAASPASTPLALAAAGLKGYSLLSKNGLIDKATHALGFGSNASSEANLPDAPADIVGSSSTDQAMLDAAGAGGVASDTGGGIGTGFGAGGVTGSALGEAPADIVGSSAADNAIATGVDAASSIGGVSPSVADALTLNDASLSGFGDTATNLGGDAVTNTAANAGTDAASATGTDASTAIGDAAASDATDAATTTLGTSAANTVGDIGAAGLPLAADAAGAAATAATGSSDLGEAVNVAADVGTAGILPAVESVVGGKVSIVCTELVKQNKVDRRMYLLGGRDFANASETFKRGYYFYAIPAVRHLRQYPESWLSQFFAGLFTKRASWVAAKRGLIKKRKAIGGFLVYYSLHALAVVTGLLVREMPDWQVVYRGAR